MRGAVAAVAAELAGDSRTELLVVDSASTDGTAAIVHQLGDDLPGLRYHRTERPGLNRARDAALATARGDVVAFLDDDARVHRGWLAGIRTGFDDAAVAAAGGPIALEWTDRPPRWMVPELASWYSGLDHGPTARDLGPTEYLWGANLAVRRAVAMAVGGFPPALGRTGDSLLSGDEIAPQDRLARAGLRRRYEPAAAVTHLVGPERASLGWVLRRAWWQGRSEAVQDRLERGAVPVSLVARRVAAHMGHRLGPDLLALVRGPARAGATVRLACTRLAGAGYAAEALALRRLGDDGTAQPLVALDDPVVRG